MDIIDSATGEIVIEEDSQTGLIMRSDGFQFTATGLVVQGQPTFEQCETMINRLHIVKDAVQMWLGDLLNYMEERWGEAYAQVVDGLDYAEGSLNNYQRVARQVPPPLRNEALTYNHYAAVAPLPQEKQAYWLNRAAEEKLSTRSLRKLIHRPQPPPPNDGRAKGVIYYEEGRLEIWCDNGNCLAQIDAIIEITQGLIDWGG